MRRMCIKHIDIHNFFFSSLFLCVALLFPLFVYLFLSFNFLFLFFLHLYNLPRPWCIWSGRIITYFFPDVAEERKVACASIQKRSSAFNEFFFFYFSRWWWWWWCCYLSSVSVLTWFDFEERNILNSTIEYIVVFLFVFAVTAISLSLFLHTNHSSGSYCSGSPYSLLLYRLYMLRGGKMCV